MPRKTTERRFRNEQIFQCGTVQIRLSDAEGHPELQTQLQTLAKEIVVGLFALKPEESEHLLNSFVSALFLSAAEESRRADRRKKQAEGIAMAKARGIRLGRPSAPLPENFNQIRDEWRSKKLTLSQAASACGMPESTFYQKATRTEDTAKC